MENVDKLVENLLAEGPGSGRILIGGPKALPAGWRRISVKHEDGEEDVRGLPVPHPGPLMSVQFMTLDDNVHQGEYDEFSSCFTDSTTAEQFDWDEIKGWKRAKGRVNRGHIRDPYA